MKSPVKVIGFSDKEGVYFYETDGEMASAHSNEFTRGEGERLMRFSFAARHLRWLQGEILTIAEATIDESPRLTATKELIKDKFNAKISWIYEQCGTPESEQDALDYSN